MENYNQPYHTGTPVEVDQNSKSNLAEAAKWAKFLGVLGFILLALMFLAGLSVMTIGASVLDAPELQDMPLGGALLGIIYLIAGIIYVYPIWALYKFGSLMRAGVQADDQSKFNEGLVYLKRFFKFIGIFTVIIIVIYVIVIIAVAAGAGFAGMQ